MAIGQGEHVLEFDLLGELSAESPGGPFGFLDTVFASLYFADDLAGFDLSPGSFDDFQELLSLDAGGPFGVNGTVGASPLGGDWLRFELSFESSFDYAIPTFELFEQNFVDGDSRVLVDNVKIRAVDTGPAIPEPGAASLYLIALALTARGIRSSSRSGANAKRGDFVR